MNKKEYARHVRQDKNAEARGSPVELETQAVFQIGDTAIIATAYYQDEGKSCADRLVNILIEEMEKQ